MACMRGRVGRVPTRSASASGWGGMGPVAGWHGSCPPASEREARMDDPMVRSRLGRANGTRPLEALDPKRGPPFFFWRDFRFEISTPLRKFHEQMPEDTICGTLPRMSPYCVFGIAIGIGVVAGLRSFTAPAVVCWGA